MKSKMPYMITVKVSPEMVSDNQMPAFINKYHPEAKGYLLVSDEKLRLRNLLTCNIFYESEGFIVITDYHAVIVDAVKYFIKLNCHAHYKHCQPGWTNDDFITNRISAKLIFTFSDDK